MLRKSLIGAAAAVAIFGGQAAQATIIGGGVTGGSSLSQGGIFIKLSVPFTESNPDNTVGENTFQTPNLYGFDEDQNIMIGAELDVNVGTNPQAGDVVASHYIFFDPGPSTSQTGFVDFDAPIFGVATSTSFLQASDFLANTGVTYQNPGLRGLESGDSAIIDPMNPNRLLVDWTASNPGDYVRVLTMRSPIADTIPVPGAILFIGLGLIAASAFGRSRQRPI
ncbi:MAG: hypothetical protein Tsb0010_04680 [Parvularculaceae bacterium]